MSAGGANLGSARGTVELDVANAIRSAKQFETALGGMERNTTSSGSGMAKSAQGIGSAFTNLGPMMAGAGAAIGGVLAVASKGFQDFQGSMANVNSIAQLSSGQLQNLSNDVLEISSITGKGPRDLADGLYDIYSSGFQGSTALEVLTASANAANAGLSSTQTAAGAITQAMNVYGQETYSAAEVSDVLFQTVNDGVVTFDQLSTQMSNVLPVANSLGIGIQDVGAAYATMTKNGVPAAQAETQIAGLMRSALNPTEALTEAVGAHGYASAEAAIRTEGLSGFLKILGEASGGSQTELMNLLGTQEAMNAATILGADGVEGYNEELDKMQHASDGAGATQKALQKQMQSQAFAMQRFRAAIDRARIALGAQLAPAMTAVFNGGTQLADAIAKLPAPVLKAVAAFAALAGGSLALGGGFLILLPKIQQIQTAFKTFQAARAASEIGLLSRAIVVLRTAMAFLLGPIGLIIAAIALLAIAYKTNFLGFADLVNAVAGAVVRALQPITDFIKTIVREFQTLRSLGVDPVSAAILALSSAFDSIGAGGIADFLKTLGDSFKTFRQNGLNPVSAGLYALQRAFASIGGENTPPIFAFLARTLGKAGQAFDKFVQRLKRATRDIRAGMRYITAAFKVGGLKVGLEAIFGKGGADILEGFGRMLGAVPRMIGDFLRGVETGFKPLDTFLHSIGRIFQDVGRIIQDIFSGEWGAALGDARKLFDDFIGHLKALGGLIIGIFNAIPWGTIFDALVSAIEAIPFGRIGEFLLNELAKIPGLIAQAAGAIPWNSIIDGAQDLSGRALTAIGNLSNKLFDWLNDAVSGIDWNKVIDGAQNLSGRALDKMGELAGRAGRWLGDAISSVHWTDLIVGALGLAEQAIAKFGSLQARAARWVGEAAAGLPWLDIIAGAFDLSGQALQKMGDLAGKVLIWVGRAVAGLPWTDIIKGALDLSGQALRSMGELAGKVLNWVSSAASGLPWTDIIAGAVDLAGRAVAKMLSLAAAVRTWVSEAAAGLPWADIIAGAVGLADDAIEKFGSLANRVTAWVNAARDAVDWPSVFSAAGEAFDTIRTAVVNVSSVISTFATTVGGWTSTIASEISGIWDTVSGPLGQVWGKIDSIRSVAETLANGIGGTVGTIQDALSGIEGIVRPSLEAVGSLVTGIGEAITGVINAVKGLPGLGGAPKEGGGTPNDTEAVDVTTTVVTNPLAGIEKEIQTSQTNIGIILGNLITDLDTFATDVITRATTIGNNFNTNVYTGFRAGQDSIDLVFIAIGTALSAFAESVGTFATTAGNNFNTMLYPGMRAGQDSAANVYAAMGSALSTFSVSVMGLFATQAGNNFNQNLYKGMRAGQESANGVFRAIGSAVSAFSTSMGTYGSLAGSRFRDGITTGFNQAAQNARGAINSISNAISGLGDQYSAGYSVGSSLGSGINAGIAGWISAIAATAVAAVNGAIAAARAAAGNPKSPSPVFMKRVGGPIGQGIWAGITKWIPGIKEAATDAVRAAIRGASAGNYALATAAAATVRSDRAGTGALGAGVSNIVYRNYVVNVQADLNGFRRMSDVADFVEALEQSVDLMVA